MTEGPISMNERIQPVSTVTKYEPSSIISEAFRTIRTAIKYSVWEHGRKVVMVTSSIPSEGKTSTLANLGILAAQDGNKTLIIDADLRPPHLHHIFRTSNRNGLSTTLSNYLDPMESVQQTDVPLLSILPSGPIQSQPSELLGLSRLEQIVDRFRGRFDVIFIDTPPILTVTDATIIARVVDNIVFVSRSMFTRREHIIQAQKNLIPFKDKVLGIVLNDVRDNS